MVAINSLAMLVLYGVDVAEATVKAESIYGLEHQLAMISSSVFSFSLQTIF